MVLGAGAAGAQAARRPLSVWIPGQQNQMWWLHMYRVLPFNCRVLRKFSNSVYLLLICFQMVTVGKSIPLRELEGIGKTDAEAETPILWPPDVKSWLIRKDPDAGKDWRQEEKGTTEDEMIGWHHRLYGHEFEQVLGDGKPGVLQSMGL